MKRHWPGTETAADVATMPFQFVQAQLPRVVADGMTAAITGRSGTGKTFAARTFAQSLTKQGVPWTWLQFSPDADKTRKEVPLRLLSSLTGGHTRDIRGEQYLLVDDLLELLTNSGRALFLDEAHNLGVAGLQRIRDVWDRSEFSFALVEIGSRLDELVGRDSVEEVLSRFDVAIHFEPLSGPELLAAVRAYHPLLATASPAQLRRINDQWAHGIWRHWATFLRHALPYAHELGTDQVTDELINLTLLAMPKVPSNKAGAR